MSCLVRIHGGLGMMLGFRTYIELVPIDSLVVPFGNYLIGF